MSLRKGAHFPPRYLADSQQILLPFLYHTRTLLSVLPTEPSYLRRDWHTRSHRPFCSSNAARASYKSSHQHPVVQRHDRDERRPHSVRWAPASQNHPVEEQKLQWSSDMQKQSPDPESPRDAAKWPSNHHQVAQTEDEKPRNSTITASEKAVFDRIFSEISNSAAKKDHERGGELEGEEGEVEQGHLEEESVGEEDIPGDPRDQLAAIFELAIAETKERNLRSLEGGHEDTHFKDGSYLRAIRLSSNSLGRATVAQEGPLKGVDIEKALLGADEESEAVLERASEDHKHFVDSMLKAANTDVEIWTVLEKEVFSLMSQLNLQTKLEDKARKADLRRQKKAAKAAADTNKPIETSAYASPTTTKIPLSIVSPTIESKALTTNTLLYILQSNYAHYCLHALRLLRSRRLSSPYALHLLPHLKSLGPISYVLGASSALYNEILYQKWIQFSDVQGMADLMEEMINQGISANITTLEFLRFVDRSRSRDLRGGNGGAKRNWWYLRPVREGWGRVKGLYHRFMGELGEGVRWDMQAMKEMRVRNGVVRRVENEPQAFRRVESLPIARKFEGVPIEQEAREKTNWEVPTPSVRPRDGLEIAPRAGVAAGGTTLRDWE